MTKHALRPLQNCIIFPTIVLCSCARNTGQSIAHHACSQWQVGHVLVAVPALGCPEVSQGDLTRLRRPVLPTRPV